MLLSFQLRFVLSGAVAITVVGGCSGSGTRSPNLPAGPGSGSPAQAVSGRTLGVTKNVLPPSVQQLVQSHRVAAHSTTNLKSMNRLPFGPFGFISDFEGGPNFTGTIYVLNANGTAFAQLSGTTNPEGMSVTNSHNVYGSNPALFVANSGGNNVLVYTSASIPTTLSNAGVEPSNVSVDSSGNVAVENVAAGTVSCFTGGATSPSFPISGTSGSGTFKQIDFGAFDGSGNLYVDGFDFANAPVVGEVVGGCGSPSNTMTDLTTSNNISYPGGVQVENNGNISIDDQTGLVIYSYNAPRGGSLGSPATTTTLSGSSDPVTISFTSGTHEVLTADAGLLDANLYAFPAGGIPVETATLPGAALPIGSAIYPSEQY